MTFSSNRGEKAVSHISYRMSKLNPTSSLGSVGKKKGFYRETVMTNANSHKLHSINSLWLLM